MWVKGHDGALVNLATAQIVIVVDDTPASVTVSYGADDVCDIYRGEKADCERILRAVQAELRIGSRQLLEVDKIPEESSWPG